MIQIPDDPIIRSIERRGYPDWIPDEDDWEDGNPPEEEEYE